VEFIFNTAEVVRILFQIHFRHLKYFVDNWLSVFVCMSHSGCQLHSVERSCLLFSVNLVCRIPLSMQNTTNKRTWSFWNPHIWLQFCSMAVSPPLDCMAKVLGVSTPLLVYSTQFIFHILDTVHKSHKQECMCIVLNSLVGKGRT